MVKEMLEHFCCRLNAASHLKPLTLSRFCIAFLVEDNELYLSLSNSEAIVYETAPQELSISITCRQSTFMDLLKGKTPLLTMEKTNNNIKIEGSYKDKLLLEGIFFCCPEKIVD